MKRVSLDRILPATVIASAVIIASLALIPSAEALHVCVDEDGGIHVGGAGSGDPCRASGEQRVGGGYGFGHNCLWGITPPIAVGVNIYWNGHQVGQVLVAVEGVNQAVCAS